MIPKFTVLLLSGGIDSTVLAYDLVSQGYKVHCVLFDYWQRHVQELDFAKYHCHILKVLYTTIEVPQLRASQLTDGKGGVIVPNRNAILLSLAVNLAFEAKSESVMFGANAGDASEFPDCRIGFVAAFNLMLREARLPTTVKAPYLGKTKSWIVHLGRELHVDLNQTWSCYHGGAEPCGKCLACQKREEALHEAILPN